MTEQFTDDQRGALLAMKKWCQDYIEHVDAWIATADNDAIHQHLDRLDDIAEKYQPADQAQGPGVKRKTL